MLRRLLVLAVVAVVVYYGYQYYVAYVPLATDLRDRADQAAGADENRNGNENPIGAAVRRRKAEEQGVKNATDKAPPSQP